jgi:hypothetical protein
VARGDVDPAELVPERAWDLGEEERMAAVEGLGVGAVREGDLDLDENLAGAGLRTREALSWGRDDLRRNRLSLTLRAPVQAQLLQSIHGQARY